MTLMPEAESNGLSIRVPMEDMTYILTQLWRCRKSEDKCNEMYEKYKALIPPYEE